MNTIVDVLIHETGNYVQWLAKQEPYESYQCSHLPNDNNSNNNSKQAERSQQDNVSTNVSLAVPTCPIWIVS